MKLSHICSAALGLASVATANFQFRSRPEFSVPRLNITVPADPSAVGKGLIFIAPYGGFGEGHHGPVQPGAYIFRDDGELVWSGVGYHAGWVANFRPDTWNGETYLRAFQGRLDGGHGRGFGFHTLLGSDYRPAKVVTAGSHRLVSVHEFRIIGERTALVETPIPRVVSLEPWGGDEGQNWVVSGGFQGKPCGIFLKTSSYRYTDTDKIEIDIATGEVLFEWESFDHVDPKCKSTSYLTTLFRGIA